MAEAARRNVAFVLPSDHVVAAAPEADAPTETVDADSIRQDGTDIGPRTVADFIQRLARRGPLSGTVRWAFSRFRPSPTARLKVGEALAQLHDAVTVIGGGDTAAAVAGHPWAKNFTHISTGGGATLEYLEGIVLPGVKALES